MEAKVPPTERAPSLAEAVRAPAAAIADLDSGSERSSRRPDPPRAAGSGHEHRARRPTRPTREPQAGRNREVRFGRSCNSPRPPEAIADTWFTNPRATNPIPLVSRARVVVTNCPAAPPSDRPESREIQSCFLTVLRRTLFLHCRRFGCAALSPLPTGGLMRPDAAHVAEVLNRSSRGPPRGS